MFLAFRNAMGIILTDVLTEFLNPIFRQHPDLLRRSSRRLSGT